MMSQGIDEQVSQSVHETRVPTVFITGLFQFFAFLLLFISLLYGQQELVLLALLVLVMFGGSRLWCRLSLKRVNCRLSSAKERAFPNEQIALKAEVTNVKFLPVWLQLKIPVDGNLVFASGEHVFTEECSLPWYGRSSWLLELKALRRGCFQIGPPVVKTGDLFGFYQRQKSFSDARQIVIYPRLVSLNYLFSPLKELFGKPGLKSPVTDPVYPVATRDYRDGNPARHIHWKASARQNRLQEKVFEPSSKRKTFLMVDVDSFSSSKEENLFERALEVVAAMAMEFDREGSPYGILSNGSVVGEMAAELPVAGGPQQLPAALEILARLQMNPAQDMKELLMQKIQPIGSLGCIYFTALPDNNFTDASEIFKHFGIPAIYVLGKSSGLTLPDDKRTCLLEDLHGENLDYIETDMKRILQEG